MSALVRLTVACDLTRVSAVAASVISERTEVVLVVVDVTAGRREEHSLAAAVFDARHPRPL